MKTLRSGQLLDLGVSKIQGPLYKPKLDGLSLQKHPQEGPPICRSSPTILTRISSKPALYQPQTSPTPSLKDFQFIETAKPRSYYITHQTTYTILSYTRLYYTILSYAIPCYLSYTILPSKHPLQFKQESCNITLPQPQSQEKKEHHPTFLEPTLAIATTTL